MESPTGLGGNQRSFDMPLRRGSSVKNHKSTIGSGSWQRLRLPIPRCRASEAPRNTCYHRQRGCRTQFDRQGGRDSAAACGDTHWSSLVISESAKAEPTPRVRETTTRAPLASLGMGNGRSGPPAAILRDQEIHGPAQSAGGIRPGKWINVSVSVSSSRSGFFNRRGSPLEGGEFHHHLLNYYSTIPYCPLGTN